MENYERDGRFAYLAGKPVESNPLIEKHAPAWEAGWWNEKENEADFLALYRETRRKQLRRGS